MGEQLKSWWKKMGVDRRRWDCASDDGDSVRTRILFHEKATRTFGGAEAEDDMATCVRGDIPLKVLFIGNSFTARNDLPGLIAQLAAARGKNLEHRLIWWSIACPQM
jgi:hypothetical protein